MSTFYVACYSGLVVPVIGVGVLSGAVGIVPAVLGFSVLLAALCLFSLARTVISLAPDRVGSSDLSVR
jgi:hypothetical protein